MNGKRNSGKEEKLGITCEDALKAFSDLGEALRKDMVTIEVPDTTGPPRMEEYSYECPECGNSMRFESKMIKIRCKKCDITFNPQIQRAIKVPEKKSYISFNERYGIKEESDWKILDINDLSDCPDILVNGRYEILCVETDIIFDIDDGINTRRFIENLMNDNGITYRYRPTPTKKTHEELAEEYAETDGWMVSTATKKHIEDAFIAGRKSMESE